ncbi:LysR family transcriptional regulator [Brevibacillus ruminantium]|uniref:LysR family transcriptional regulator n=1 Tax=Brevibacillus ruminantium TaxID=2950604 RepID=A0ABY4WK29_9BACL|nr:LysR family transcriptional regulator [Brevibacillus ruminantium]USG65006.1 LysR family transcriptional regulator [Brevibacillus ruminantium]
MDYKDWDILTVLNEERNFTKASQRLFISQPALTYRIQHMEEFFKSTLFVRNRNGVQLTPQGELVVQYAEEMKKRLQTVRDTIESMGTEVKGTIKIGVSSTFGQYILPEMLHQYLGRFPQVNVQIITGFSCDIMQLLVSRDIHLAIVKGTHHWHEEKIPLSDESICVVSKEPLDIDQLPSLPRINYQMDPHLKEMIDDWWKQKFHEPSLITMFVDNLETCKEMVKIGRGYTILPSICLQNEQGLFVQPLHKEDGTSLHRKTWIYCHHSSMNFAIVRSFFHFLTEYQTPALLQE